MSFCLGEREQPLYNLTVSMESDMSSPHNARGENGQRSTSNMNFLPKKEEEEEAEEEEEEEEESPSQLPPSPRPVPSASICPINVNGERSSSLHPSIHPP